MCRRRRGFPRARLPTEQWSFSRAFVSIVELGIPIHIHRPGLLNLPVLLDRVSLTLFGEVGGRVDGGNRGRRCPAFDAWIGRVRG